jgi:hypothetical protein
VARLPIEDRDRRRRLAKLQLDDRESVQRGIRDLDALPRQQLANLGETKAVAEPALDHRALLDTPRPPVAARSPTSRMQREEHLTDLFVADRGGHGDAGSRGRLQIAADGLRIEPELGSDAFLRQPRAS